MPITTGMLLGMIKSLEKRIRILESTSLKEEVRTDGGTVCKSS